MEKLNPNSQCFAKYTSRQAISRFLARCELFKMVLNVKGSIVECGVFEGQGLMTWAQLSSIYEPYHFYRKIIGFDTFAGFPEVEGIGEIGDLCGDYEELKKCIELYDLNRPLGHMKKIKIIKGDFLETGKKFIKDNPHILVSLLFLDFDMYKPTKEALNLFLPRMGKNAIIAFDQINNPYWVGETQALLETFDLRGIELKQFPYEPNIAYLKR